MRHGERGETVWQVAQCPNTTQQGSEGGRPFACVCGNLAAQWRGHKT